MPELPDIELYLHALRPRLLGEETRRVPLRSPSLLRTYASPLESIEGQFVTGLCRLGKRIAWRLQGERFLVFHLMIARRFHLRNPEARLRQKQDLACFAFKNLSLMLPERSQGKRASLHLIEGKAGLLEHQRDGVDVADCSLEEFSRLDAASRELLDTWVARLQEQSGDIFPERVTAMSPEMAVHGKFGRTYPVCGTSVQRIVHSANEYNDCLRCQTDGKVPADRSLSRLLKADCP